jgi:porin
MRVSIAGVFVVLASALVQARETEPAATQPVGALATQPAPPATTQPAQGPTTQPASAPAVPAACHPLDPPLGLKSKTATGDWFGLRPALRDAGIETQFYYQDQFMSVLGGGKSTGGGKNSATIDWFVILDFQKMKLIKDADALIQTRAGWGYSVNPYTGATKGFDVNDDADGITDYYIDQLWYRQHFFDRKLALQVGYLDFQTIVDRNAYANSEDKQFMNTALDNSPFVPTAAITTLGAALYIQPLSWYTLILGAGNAQGPQHGAPNPSYKPDFDTTFHDQAWFVGYIEHDLSFKIPGPRGPLPGNYRFGMFYDPRSKPKYLYSFQPPEHDGQEWAFYTSCDQMVFRENDKDDQGLGVFFRYGHRRPDINRFSDFWSAGVSYTGLIPDRDKDVLGLGFAEQISSDMYHDRVNRDTGPEAVYELYYAIQLTPWLVLSPDFQYLNDPGANHSIPHAIVGGVRLRMSF